MTPKPSLVGFGLADAAHLVQPEEAIILRHHAADEAIDRRGGGKAKDQRRFAVAAQVGVLRHPLAEAFAALRLQIGVGNPLALEVLVGQAEDVLGDGDGQVDSGWFRRRARRPADW